MKTRSLLLSYSLTCISLFSFSLHPSVWIYAPPFQIPPSEKGLLLPSTDNDTTSAANYYKLAWNKWCWIIFCSATLISYSSRICSQACLDTPKVNNFSPYMCNYRKHSLQWEMSTYTTERASCWSILSNTKNRTWKFQLSIGKYCE